LTQPTPASSSVKFYSAKREAREKPEKTRETRENPEKPKSSWIEKPHVRLCGFKYYSHGAPNRIKLDG
jgi:hypothetical protein